MYLICKLANVEVDLTALRELTKTTASGTSMLALKNAATELGFSASAKHLAWSDLRAHLADEAGFAILFCGTNHFVAATGIAGDSITVIDPAAAIREIDESASVSALRWSGKALLLRRPDVSGDAK